MKRIIKYRLIVTDTQDIVTPPGAVILSVAYQENELVVWVLVPDGRMHTFEELHKLTIRIFGTGHGVDHPDRLVFIGTVEDPMGQLIWHVFYELRVD